MSDSLLSECLRIAKVCLARGKLLYPTLIIETGSDLKVISLDNLAPTHDGRVAQLIAVGRALALMEPVAVIAVMDSYTKSLPQENFPTGEVILDRPLIDDPEAQEAIVIVRLTIDSEISMILCTYKRAVSLDGTEFVFSEPNESHGDAVRPYLLEAFWEGVKLGEESHDRY